MKSFATFAIASGLLGLASAQFYPTPSPDDITPETRDIWCIQQEEACPLICQDQGSGNADINDCDAENLTFQCVCEDGKVPNVTEYSITLPYNICQWSKQECANRCRGEAACANQCFTGKTCGALDPRRHNVTSTTTTSTQTATGSNKPSGSGSNDDDKFDQGAASQLSVWGATYGVAVMIAGMGAGFVGML